jgi:DNA repair exonuclease SbcCD nuclease subunit
MSKIAVIADLHIGVNKDNDIFHKIHLDYAKWLSDELKHRHIDTLVIAGDFFHDRSKITLPTLDVGHKFLDILKEFNIYIGSGNHDSYHLNSSNITSLSVFKNRTNIQIIDDKIRSYDKFSIMPWGTEFKDIPDGINVLFCHIDAISFEMAKGKISTHGFKVSDLMTKASLVISGHFHKFQHRIYNGKSFYYTGSPMQLSFGESGDTKYFHIVDLNTLNVEQIENTVSPKFKYIRTEADLTDIKGNFISVVSTDETLVEKVGAHSPVFVRKEIIDEFKKLDERQEEVKEFKVVDIPEAIEEFSIKLPDEWKLDDELKKEVAVRTTKLYDQLK